MRQFRCTVGTGLLAGALAAGMTIAGATMAAAQSSGSSPGTPPAGPRTAAPPAAAAASITDQELMTFAVAALEVRKINDAYRPRYQSADTPAEKQQVQKEATDKMAAAVSQKGLSVDKYNQIVRVAQSDPDVAKQIDGYARSAQ